jgi:leucyl aminopeptidase
LKMGVSTRSGLVGKALVFDAGGATGNARLNSD